MARLSILRVVSNGQLNAEEERLAKLEVDARQQQPVILGMAAYLRTCFDAAKFAKSNIENIMLKAKLQRNGEYEPEKLTAIHAQGGSQIFMRITEVKCRAAESWVRDILLDSGMPPWDLTPTPIPDLKPEQLAEMQKVFTDKLIQHTMATGQAPTAEELADMNELYEQEYRYRLQQVAQTKADRMAELIKDQFAEGGWVESFNDFVTDLVTYPAAFIKGPVVRRQMQLGWEQGQDGRTTVQAVERLAPEFERVDPFRIYPEPGISTINEGYIFEHHPMPRSELAALIGVPGYDEGAIRAILENGSQQSWFFSSIEMSKNELERKQNSWNTPTAIYDALEFWGKISGKMLREWGLSEEEVPDEAREYDANVWLVGNYVIKAVLNYDPLGEKPYAKSSFFKVPGAFWGMGIPEVIEDIQAMCNAAARALANNMGIASGPQVEVAVDRVPANEDITQVYPWKIWQVLSDPQGSVAPAVRFDQPTDNSASLMQVYERFSQLADEHSGIPSYVSGDISVTGAGRTSSGLSMLMGAAGKGIRQVVTHIDNDVIKVIVKRQFVFNMRYDDDESIKGDVVIVPRGAVNLAIKETTNVRRIEFLNATANPIDAEIIGYDGRAAILREIAKALQMPQDEIVPSREKMKFKSKMISQGALPPPGQQPEPQALDPSGAPKGGMEGNTVSNRQTGSA